MFNVVGGCNYVGGCIYNLGLQRWWRLQLFALALGLPWCRFCGVGKQFWQLLTAAVALEAAALAV